MKQIIRHMIAMVCVFAITMGVTASGAPTKRDIDYAAAADSAYNRKEYSQALSLYRQAVDNQGVSSNLYYNMGNTQYRLGSLSQAILNYERALRLDPSNSDARTNLEFVKTKIIDRPEDDSSFLSNVHDKIKATLSPDGWALLALLLFAAVMGCVALYIFTPAVTGRKVGFFAGIFLLCIFIYTAVIAWSTSRPNGDDRAAIVTASTTNLSSSPGTPKNSTDKVLPVHEGTKLQVLDSVATPDDSNSPMWYHVKINNTTQAWVAANDVELI